MGELRSDPSEIIPYARQDFFDLGGGFLRKRRHQVGTAGAMLGQPGPDCAHEGAGKVRHPVRIGPAHQVEQRHGGKADQRIDAALETSGISLPSTAECPPHRLRTQKCTTILPNTCRLASRSRPAAKSASSTSVSITGVSPAAILTRLSRMLPMVAPNEPKIRYCCWNSCIRLSVVLGPDGEVEEVASKAVDMKTENALDVFAKVVPALAAGPAFSAGERAIHDDAVPDTKTGYAGSHCRDLACGFRADHQRQLAFGERHAAPAPHVDVIERHRPDPNLHLAGGRRRRRGRLPQLELAVGNEGQRSHRSRLAGKSETVGRSAPNACRRMDGPVNERCSKRLRISVETEPSRRFAPHHQRHVLAAESEGI